MPTLQQAIQAEFATYFNTVENYAVNYKNYLNQINDLTFKKDASPFKLGATHFTKNREDIFQNTYFKQALETTLLTAPQKLYLADTFINGQITQHSIHALFTHIAGNGYPQTAFKFEHYNGKKLEQPFVINKNSDSWAEEPYDITICLQEQINMLAISPNISVSNMLQIDKLTCAKFLADVHLNMLDAGALQPYDYDYEGDDETYDTQYTENTKTIYQGLRNLFTTNLQATVPLVKAAKAYDTGYII